MTNGAAGPETRPLGVLFILVATGFLSLAQVAFKLGAEATPVLGWIVGAALYFGGFYFTLAAYRHGRVSVLFPITSVSHVLCALAGVFLFAEEVTATQWAGLALIVVGSAILGSDERRAPAVLAAPARLEGA